MELSCVASVAAMDESEEAALCARGPQASMTAPAQRSQIDSRDEITIQLVRDAGRRGGDRESRCVTT
jgi:hypothetical protein